MTNRSELHDRRGERGDTVAQRWNLVAVALALLTGLGAALLPLGMQSSVESNGTQTSTSVSLLSNEGPSVLIVVAIPILLVALPLLVRAGTAKYRASVLAVTLLSLLVMLGSMSIGLFFVPTLTAMIVSLSARQRASL